MIIKDDRRGLIPVCILYSVNAIVVTVQTYINGKVIESAENGERNNVFFLLGIAITILIVGYLLTILSTYLRFKMMAEGCYRLNKEILVGIFKHPISSFMGTNDSYYLNLITNDTTMYRQNVLGIIPYICYSVVSIISVSAVLIRLNPFFFLAGIVSSVFPLLSGKKFAVLEGKKKKNYSKESEKYINLVKETIEGREILRFSETKAYAKRYDEYDHRIRTSWINYSFISAMSFETLMSVSSLANIICLAIGCFLVFSGELSTGMLFTATGCFGALSNGASNVIDYFVNVCSTREIIEKIKKEICNYSMHSKTPNSFVKEPIRVNIVGLKYGFNGTDLYGGLDILMEEGGCYAIIGDSGCGKTTLARLILGYYDKYEGEIYLNNKNIKTITEDEICSKATYVRQSPYIFNASIEDNIVMFDKHANYEEYNEILEVLKLKDLAERVCDEPLGDFGESISGGERQRIAVARAFYRKTGLIIFDEPVASLDPESRDVINEAIFNIKNCTRVVITHDRRKDYLSRFDKVISVNR